MRKIKCILGLTLSAILIFSGCVKDDINELRRQQEEIAGRVAALEKWQQGVNGNILALQSLVTALQNNDHVTGVVPFAIPAPGGYRITFTKSGEATIWNGNKGDKGEQGDKGAVPVIGVAQFPDNSGTYFWTLNGEFMLVDGQKIPVTGEKGDKGENGATPKVAIGSDYRWHISPDGNATGTPPNDTGWINTGVLAVGPTGPSGPDGPQGEAGPQGDAIFAPDGIDCSHDDYVVFTLADGSTTFTIPKATAITIGFDNYETFYGSSDNNEITLVLPPTLKETDYRAIMAVVTNEQGTDIQTRSAIADTWTVRVTKPTFTGGILDEGSAKVTLSAPESIKLSETAWLRVTITDKAGRENTAARPVKYFDGVILESSAGNLNSVITDASVKKLAITGSINEEDFTYIRENLIALEVLDISMTDLANMPDRGLRYTTPNKTLKRVVLPPNLVTIGSAAFENCAALEYIDIENTKIIGGSAFRNCTNLRKIKLGNSLQEIGMYAFYQCHLLQTVEIPGSVTTLGKCLFMNSGIASITIPANIKQIPDGAFQDCKYLERITLHDDINDMGAYAFLRCRALEKIKIPTGVKVLKHNMFDGCGSLQYVDFHDGITGIGERAFAYCRKLQGQDVIMQRLTLPAGLITMEEGAFQYCESLVRVRIPNLENIPNYAFSSCKNLIDIELPSNLKTIGEWVFFENTMLPNIDLPSGVTSVGNYAFHQCAKLTSVQSYPLTAPTIGANTFDPAYKTARNLRVRSGTNYNAWANYFNKINTNL